MRVTAAAFAGGWAPWSAAPPRRFRASVVCSSGPPNRVESYRNDSGGEARLDKFLAQRVPPQGDRDGPVHSRSYFQTLVKDGWVRVQGKVMARPGYRVRPGEDVQVEFGVQRTEADAVRLAGVIPEPIDLDVVYEDHHMVAVNKAAGMVVHPAPGNWSGTLVNALAFRYPQILDLAATLDPSAADQSLTTVQAGDHPDFEDDALDDHAVQDPAVAAVKVLRPGIVHRLDKGTTGVILAAKTSQARSALVALFAERKVYKTYLAITVGNPAGKGCTSSTIDAPIGRDLRRRERMTIVPVDEGGRRALSRVQVLAVESAGNLFLVKVVIETGRTHQIRVHMQHRLAPVLGDDLYGVADVNNRFRSAARRPLLHALAVEMKHPITGADLKLTAELPPDMVKLVESRLIPGFGQWTANDVLSLDKVVER